MARVGRRTPRPGGTPGHGVLRRRRSVSRSGGPAANAPEVDETGVDEAGADEAGTDEATARELNLARRRSGITTRAIALGVVVLLLTISYASSLRVFFEQQRDLAAAEAEIQQRHQRIDDLEAELARWQDPAYVQAQARERLGWVVPGETGYRVVGPDGKPIVPGAEVEAEQGTGEKNTWWQKLEGSVRTADGPAPARTPPTPPAEPTTPPRTVGPSTNPTAKPS